MAWEKEPRGVLTSGKRPRECHEKEETHGRDNAMRKGERGKMNNMVK